MNRYVLSGLAVLFAYAPIVSSVSSKADAVVVDKSDSRLYLKRNGKVIESFRVTFGSDPKGHKVQQGDGRTPEGNYTLDYKNPHSRYHKSIHISYPNSKDRANARRLGVNPGGDIMIHGQPNDWGWASTITQLFNWTDGCIALTNKDMDVVWSTVDAGTPILIRP